MPPGAVTILEPLVEERRLPPSPPRTFGDEGRTGPESGEPGPPVSNARIGVLAFVVFESMLFAGLLSAHTVLRTASAAWPPPGQPYLPIGMTWVNTAILLGSCVPLIRARRGSFQGGPRVLARHLTVSALMGAAFLAVQGIEWARLVAHGMSVADGVYGATFVLLIGTHGLHVLGAVIWLGALALLALSERMGPRGRASLDACAIYWYFVSIVWAVVFALVYLA
jgi:heme/copper-type cytochrome/quinol oxidase subunit 3